VGSTDCCNTHGEGALVAADGKIGASGQLGRLVVEKLLTRIAADQISISVRDAEKSLTSPNAASMSDKRISRTKLVWSKPLQAGQSCSWFHPNAPLYGGENTKVAPWKPMLCTS